MPPGIPIHRRSKGRNMAVSSGTKSLFSTLIAFAVMAGTTAYGLKHRDQIFRTVSEFQGQLAPDKPADSGAAGASDDAGDARSGSSAGDVELKANASGHFETEAEINGRSIGVMVDTGATMVALTWEDAERAGIYLRSSDFTHETQTANGKAKIAPIKISAISVGGITVRNVNGAVAEPGKLKQTLLGMSFLNRLSRVEMQSKTLILKE
jgi:aspartyl protease family protein